MVLLVNILAAKPDNMSLIPGIHIERKKQTSTSCLLISTHSVICMHVHTHTNKSIHICVCKHYTYMAYTLQNPVILFKESVKRINDWISICNDYKPTKPDHIPTERWNLWRKLHPKPWSQWQLIASGRGLQCLL